jgi:adenosine deaminase
MAEIKSFISRLPKCELRVHLEGTLELSLARTLAARNNLPIPEDLGEDSDNYPFYDLPSFLKVYYAAMSCLNSVADFEDLAYAYLAKAHSQNVIHTEMFFDPQAHTSRGVDFETVISGLVNGVTKAKEEFAISTKLIMCFLRDHSAESAAQTLTALVESPHRSHVVGVGLDSDEKNNPPKKFADVYKMAKEYGLRTTMHCDVDQSNSIEHIRQALLEIQVERIGHGTNVIEYNFLVG